MDIHNPPRSFGVFSPVDHILIALPTAAQMEAAVEALQAQGFAESALLRYRPADMLAQLAADLKQASPLAVLGQELNLQKAHGLLAEQGCSFLLVHAPEDEQAAQVTAVARSVGAVAAQRYGSFMIEELITPPPGGPLIFESADKT